MYEIILQIAELIFEIIFIVWLIYHFAEYLWIFFTKRPPEEMHRFITNIIKKS